MTIKTILHNVLRSIRSSIIIYNCIFFYPEKKNKHYTVYTLLKLKTLKMNLTNMVDKNTVDAK